MSGTEQHSYPRSSEAPISYSYEFMNNSATTTRSPTFSTPIGGQNNRPRHNLPTVTQRTGIAMNPPVPELPVENDSDLMNTTEGAASANPVHTTLSMQSQLSIQLISIVRNVSQGSLRTIIENCRHMDVPSETINAISEMADNANAHSPVIVMNVSREDLERMVQSSIDYDRLWHLFHERTERGVRSADSDVRGSLEAEGSMEGKEDDEEHDVDILGRVYYMTLEGFCSEEMKICLDNFEDATEDWLGHIIICAVYSGVSGTAAEQSLWAKRILHPFIIPRETNDKFDEGMRYVEEIKLFDSHKSEYFVIPIVVGSKLYLGYGQAKTLSLIESTFMIFSGGVTESEEKEQIKNTFPSSFETNKFKFVNLAESSVLQSLSSLHDLCAHQEVLEKLSPRDRVWWLFLCFMFPIEQSHLASVASTTKKIFRTIGKNGDLSLLKKELFCGALSVVLSLNNSVRVRDEEPNENSHGKDGLQAIINEISASLSATEEETTDAAELAEEETTELHDTGNEEVINRCNKKRKVSPNRHGSARTASNVYNGMGSDEAINLVYPAAIFPNDESTRNVCREIQKMLILEDYLRMYSPNEDFTGVYDSYEFGETAKSRLINAPPNRNINLMIEGFDYLLDELRKKKKEVKTVFIIGLSKNTTAHLKLVPDFIVPLVLQNKLQQSSSLNDYTVVNDEGTKKKCVFNENTGHIIIRASNNVLAVLLMTYNLWKSKFTCFPTSGWKSEALMRMVKEFTENALTGSGYKGDISVMGARVPDSVKGQALDDKKFTSDMKNEGCSSKNLKHVNFFILVPLMTTNAKWEEWKSGGETRQFEGCVGCDKGGFCFTKLRLEEEEKTSDRHGEVGDESKIPNGMFQNESSQDLSQDDVNHARDTDSQSRLDDYKDLLTLDFGSIDSDFTPCSSELNLDDKDSMKNSENN